jgi:ATP-grasp domain
MSRADAFVLLGGLRVIVRNWLYLTELHRRGLRILVITSESWRAETERAMADEAGAGSLIDEAGFVAGSVEVEGGFTAGVIATILDWNSRYRIVGVFAAGEMLVEQTGIIADALGLPGPGLRAARVCRNKYLQRFYLAPWSPPVTIVPPEQRQDLDPSDLKFPLVLKPSGRRSSSGVVEIVGTDELLAALPDYAPAETLLLEQCIIGQEYSVESLVQDGRIMFESVTLKNTNEHGSDVFVELGHTVPAPDAPENALLLKVNREIVQRLAFGDGIVHSELRVTDSGEVVVMEVAARTPGDGILPLYHLATGQPMEPAILRTALGEPADYPAPRRHARQIYLDHTPGLLRGVRLDWPDVTPVWVGRGGLWPAIEPGAMADPPTLRAVIVLKARDTVLQSLRESDDRAVTFLIDAPSVAELDELERHVRAALTVQVDEVN